MVIVMFRNHQRPGDQAADYGQLVGRMVKIVSTLPGFVSVEQFTGAGGEVLILAKFESEEALEGWRNHAGHRKAQGRRGDFYEDYTVQVCTSVREYGWQRVRA